MGAGPHDYFNYFNYFNSILLKLSVKVRFSLYWLHRALVQDLGLYWGSRSESG